VAALNSLMVMLNLNGVESSQQVKDVKQNHRNSLTAEMSTSGIK